MDKRKSNLKKYGISSKRYKELCGFCEQYPEWKSEINNMSFLSGVSISDMPSSLNKNADTTADMAIRMDGLLSKCELIERTAKECSKDLWKYLIDNICYEAPVDYLIAKQEMPISRRSFFDLKRYFFYILDKNKKI